MEGEFLPFLLLQFILFYASALLIIALKRKNKWPDHTGFDKKFDSPFYVAWHVPMIFMSLPMGSMALAGSYELWLSGDIGKMHAPGDMGPLISEVSTWFICFFVMETVQMIVHGLGSVEMYLHHLIFGSVALIIFRGCACPFTGAMLIAQEMSTPALNMFILLRAYIGLESLVTQCMFLLFAILFLIFRIVFNTMVTIYFFRAVWDGVIGISPIEQCILSVAIAGGALLQMKWGGQICSKIYGAFFGGAKAEEAERSSELNSSLSRS